MSPKGLQSNFMNSHDAPSPRPEGAGAVIKAATASRLTVFEASAWPLLLICALGALLRLAPTVLGNFPLGDGGLYLVMTKAFEGHGFILPSTVTYGQDSLLYAYPPAAFIMTAALHSLTGIAELRLMSLLPPLFATATIPAAYLVARDFFKGEPELCRGQSARHLALATALIFALSPNAYRIIFLGGGLTKAPGLFFGLLAIWCGLRLLREQRAYDVILTSLFGGIALLFHPDGGLFVAISLTLLVLRHWSVRNLSLLILAAAGAAVVSAPWWAQLVMSHGISPLLSAGSVSAELNIITFFTGNAPPILLLWLFWAGLIMVARRRSWILPLWLFIVIWLDSRNVVHDGAFVLAMIASLGALYGGRRALNFLVSAYHRLGLPGATEAPVLRRLVVVIFVVITAVPTLLWPLSAVGPRVPLGPGDVAAMSWLKTSGAPGGAVVLTGSPWWYDDLSEWFPALSDHTNLNAVQGYEWLGQAAWAKKIKLSADLQACVLQTVPLFCLESALTQDDARPTLLYVAGPDSETAIAYHTDFALALRLALDADPTHWQRVFHSNFASIYQRAGTPP